MHVVTIHAFVGQTDRRTDRQTEFSSLDRVTVVEYRRIIMSVNIVSQLQSSTFGHKPTLQRGLSAIAELLVVICSVHH